MTGHLLGVPVFDQPSARNQPDVSHDRAESAAHGFELSYAWGAPWEVFDLHTDHLGSVRAITIGAGGLVSLHNYFPFGEEITSQLSYNTHQYTGHERDKETDLDYMLARYYGAGVGRFLSVDPIDGGPSNTQTWNRYTYVGNNPITNTDPTGRVKISAADRADYEAAKAYVSQEVAGKAAFRLLESATGPQEPTLVTNSQNDDSFDATNNVINWDPRSGLDVSGPGGTSDSTGNSVQTPALGLFHEIAHKVHSDTDPVRYASDTKKGSDPQYQTKEEGRVIAGAETKIAKGLDEPTRTDHKPKPTPRVIGPTSKK